MIDWYDEIFEGRVRFGLRAKRRYCAVRSPHQTIEIVETEQFGRVLVLDGVFQTSEADEHFYHEMLVHPAMVTAPSISRALVIGGGDGGTVREVLRYPEVEQVVMVEIDRMVVEACREHLATIGTAWDDRRLELIIDDAAAWVRAAEDVEPFDVILLDGGDPLGPSEGLFDESFYRDCARRLTPRGTFSCQSESPSFFPEVFRDIVGTLQRVFGVAAPYFGPVPLYAAGSWSWTMAGRQIAPAAVDEQRIARIERSTRYYNRDIHHAAFAVPNDLKQHG